MYATFILSNINDRPLSGIVMVTGDAGEVKVSRVINGAPYYTLLTMGYEAAALEGLAPSDWDVSSDLRVYSGPVRERYTGD